MHFLLKENPKKKDSIKSPHFQLVDVAPQQSTDNTNIKINVNNTFIKL